MMNKTKLALGIATATLTLAGALVSPQAAAGSKAQHHAEVAGVSSKVDALEAQLQAMQAELSSLRASANRPADSRKVQELDEWMTSVKSAPKEKAHHDNTLSFRGGFAHMDQSRNDILTGGQTVLNSGGADTDAWYIGAGFDFSLTDDVWGAMNNTQVLAELMFEYKEFGTQTNRVIPTTNPLCATTNFAGTVANASGTDCNTVTVSQLSLTAAPKVKFMKGSAFRPWIIPVGLGIHIISPPSNGVTVFNPGVMFGAGADYKVWKDIYVGADARYHLTGNAADGVNTDGYTAGGYLGIGF
jgi:opacity protein-like surface antigen